MKKEFKSASFLAISGMGVGIFFVYALLYCVFIALESGISDTQRVLDLIGSSAFQTAFLNTCVLMTLFVISVILLSLVIVYLLDDTPKSLYFLTILSVAVVIPSVSITSVFSSFPTSLAEHPRLVLFFIYLWKYTGICALILKAAAANIDPQLAEAAAMEGASKFTFFRKIYLFQLLPHIKFLFVFNIIGFFRLFRESYLLYGMYPPLSIYLIPNYLYNNFSNLNFQKISVASVITMGVLLIMNLAVIKIGDKNEGV